MQLIQTLARPPQLEHLRVANELGLTRRGLYLKIARYGIAKAA